MEFFKRHDHIIDLLFLLRRPPSGIGCLEQITRQRNSVREFVRKVIEFADTKEQKGYLQAGAFLLEEGSLADKGADKAKTGKKICGKK